MQPGEDERRAREPRVRADLLEAIQPCRFLVGAEQGESGPTLHLCAAAEHDMALAVAAEGLLLRELRRRGFLQRDLRRSGLRHVGLGLFATLGATAAVSPPLATRGYGAVLGAACFAMTTMESSKLIRCITVERAKFPKVVLVYPDPILKMIRVKSVDEGL